MPISSPKSLSIVSALIPHHPRFAHGDMQWVIIASRKDSLRLATASGASIDKSLCCRSLRYPAGAKTAGQDGGPGVVASDSFAEFLREQLAPLGRVTMRRMFGKTGVFCDGVMFGMVTDNM